MTNLKDKAISTEARLQCECCSKWKICRMYIIPTGEATWICQECRKGNKND